MRLCQIGRFATSYFTAHIILHLDRDAEWRGTFLQERPPRYGAYLLRYWEVRSECPGRPTSWQFSLEAAGTGERRGFHGLEALLAYLARELAPEDAGATGAQENEETGELESPNGRFRRQPRRKGDEEEGS
jgi:hypothetical protein